MTTQSGEGGKKTASPNQTETIHLISDHDNIGEPQNWCGAESMKSNDKLAETTCINCLKAAKVYGEGAAQRLLLLSEAPAHKEPEPCCGRAPLRSRPCNDYRPPNSEAGDRRCLICDHLYLCHPESVAYAEGAA